MLIKLFDKGSIYFTIKNNYKNGRIDSGKVSSILDGEDGDIKFAPELANRLSDGKSYEYKEGINTLKTILKKINSKEIIGYKELEKKLLDLEFNLVDIIDDFLEEIDQKELTNRVNNIFRDLFYKTKSKKTMKLAIEITGLFHNEDMIQDYLMVGQYREFTLYVSFVLLIWHKNNSIYKKAIIDLLSNTKDWGTINLVEFMLESEEFLKDIKIQRDILVYSMRNITIPMEVSFTLGLKLDIERLLELSVEDEDLLYAINDLFSSLFFEVEALGGILDLTRGMEYVELYLDALCKTKFPSEKLYGLLEIKKFLNMQGDKLLSIDQLLGRVKKEIRETYKNDIIRYSLKNNKRSWYWSDFVINNKIYGMIDIFEEKIEKNNLDYIALKVLYEIGKKKHQELIFRIFKENFDIASRKKVKYSHANVFRKKNTNYLEIPIMIASLGKLATPEAIEYIKYALEDFDPFIKRAALEAITYLNKDKIDNKITDLVKKRLKDSPGYIREEALRICLAKNIKISNEEYLNILGAIKNDKEEINDEFESSLKDIMLKD